MSNFIFVNIAYFFAAELAIAQTVLASKINNIANIHERLDDGCVSAP